MNNITNQKFRLRYEHIKSEVEVGSHEIKGSQWYVFASAICLFTLFSNPEIMIPDKEILLQFSHKLENLDFKKISTLIHSVFYYTSLLLMFALIFSISAWIFSNRANALKRSLVRVANTGFFNIDDVHNIDGVFLHIFPFMPLIEFTDNDLVVIYKNLKINVWLSQAFFGAFNICMSVSFLSLIFKNYAISSPESTLAYFDFFTKYLI